MAIFPTELFGPPFFRFNIEDGLHDVFFNVDVCGPRAIQAARLHIFFRSTEILGRLNDGALIYKCTIEGPKRMLRFATGRARDRSDGDFDLELFHITNPTAAAAIQASHKIWSSRWNLQGTRRLKNVAYIYLTSLPSVTSEKDLRRIAMASGGKIELQTTSPRPVEKNFEMTVYRESTTGRTTPLPVTVPTAYIAPPHLLLHLPVTVPPYYEVVCPEIFRIGVNPGVALKYNGAVGSTSHAELRRFDYLVLGDATEVEGLAAPFDEEDTSQIVHIERLGPTEDIFSFWWTHRNSDQMTGRAYERREFEPDPPV